MLIQRGKAYANIIICNPLRIIAVNLFLTIYSPKKLVRPDHSWNTHKEHTIGEAKVAILDKFKCVVFFNQTKNLIKGLRQQEIMD